MTRRLGYGADEEVPAMYCTLQDILMLVREEVLLRLTDDAGAISQEVVAKAVQDASAEIDAYAQSRYPVPFAPVPQIINKMAVDIAIYNLFTRHGFDPDGQDKVIVDRHKAAVKFLENLSRGLVQIGAPTPKQTAEQPAIIISPPRIFTREKMRPL